MNAMAMKDVRSCGGFGWQEHAARAAVKLAYCTANLASPPAAAWRRDRLLRPVMIL
jgi:hypothetical protein